MRKCTPTSPPKTKPPVKVHPHEKKTHSIQVLEHARHPYPCQMQPRKETHPEAHKRQREPTEPKPKAIRKSRPVHPETNPSQPAHSNHADPSEPPPSDRKGTGISNRNQDKEPETEPEPPKTKQRPHPSKANHPRRKPTPTPTFEQLPEHIRHWTPRLTPPHPLPQTLHPTSRMYSLKEGAPAMRWDLPTSFGGPYAHRCTKGLRARAGCPGMQQPKTPATYPPGPKTAKAQPGPQPGGG
ncbi:extensin-like [Girardinichthys multiradiatus]|uniref:extensin-like n=1 Tax=Girardinichthys multiradiatus TaxID=208333 RepID=UPI001FAB6BCC|nr:extensin-like [Girardinichthys multiradiatus]